MPPCVPMRSPFVCVVLFRRSISGCNIPTTVLRINPKGRSWNSPAGKVKAEGQKKRKMLGHLHALLYRDAFKSLISVASRLLELHRNITFRCFCCCCCCSCIGVP
uniref:Uncharacterized protein n=1 Tax=Physcomitrium patens TaxID=3218 RepID=A0A2K1J562_PHYPA|nr:hypothetical protein PHYPA_022513 [Physcomitrium patens]